jgi:hypothetical protein
VVLGGVLYVNYFRSSASPSESPRRSPAQSARSVATQSQETASVIDVTLERLDTASATYSPAKRDLFRFRPKPAPEARGPVGPPPVQLPPPTQTRSRPQVESLVRYIGYAVSESGAAIATLTVRPDSTSTPIQFVGVAGDVIEGRYRLQRVEPNAIEVVELGSDGRRARIPRS